MADPILGRAYPALLAPGLRVHRDGDRQTAIVLRDPVLLDAPINELRVCVFSYGQVWTARVEYLWVDYADPHTRDRVCRALAATIGDAAALAVRDRPERLRAVADAVLRDLADAVWGEAAPESAEMWSTIDALFRLRALDVPGALIGGSTRSTATVGIMSYACDMAVIAEVSKKVFNAALAPRPDPEFGDDGYREAVQGQALEALEWAERWYALRERQSWGRTRRYSVGDALPESEVP